MTLRNPHDRSQRLFGWRLSAMLIALFLISPVSRGLAANVSSSLNLQPGELILVVNTITGDLRLYGYDASNLSDTPRGGLYEITSVTGSLNPTKWTSLTSQNVQTVPSGGWEELSRNSHNLSEDTINVTAYTAIGADGNTPSLSLGKAFVPGAAQDLAFQWFDNSFDFHASSVRYFNGPIPEPTGLAFPAVAVAARWLGRRRAERNRARN